MPRPDPLVRAFANYQRRLSTVKWVASGTGVGVAIHKLAQHQEQELQQRVTFPNELPHVKIAVLGSTRGTSSQPIIDAIKNRTLRASIQCIISNDPNAYILRRAQENGIEGIHVPRKRQDGTVKSNDERFLEITNILKNEEVELIICAGFNLILPPSFVNTWSGRALNVHPSLLPKHAGGFDLQVHEKVLKSGDVESGTTVHIITEEVDGGPIVAQMRCPVLPGDTPQSLKDRVQPLEGQCFIKAIEEFAAQKREHQYRAQVSGAAEEVMERVMVRNSPMF